MELKLNKREIDIIRTSLRLLKLKPLLEREINEVEDLYDKVTSLIPNKNLGDIFEVINNNENL